MLKFLAFLSKKHKFDKLCEEKGSTWGMEDIYIKYTKDEIESRRKAISMKLIHASSNIKCNNIVKLSPEDLRILLEIYDDVFLENWIAINYKGRLQFSLSKRMSKSAGKTICTKNLDKERPEFTVIEIRIGVEFLFNYDSLESDKRVCGIKTQNNLEALMLVFEHELCHMIEFVKFGSSKCSGERFKKLAQSIFGHTQSYHELPTVRKIAQQNYGLNVGCNVWFDFEGKDLKGIIYKLNKRATVMVLDKNGTYSDSQGNRYSKYYVPYQELMNRKL